MNVTHHSLYGNVTGRDGLTVGGIGNVIGAAQKANQLAVTAFEMMKQVVQHKPDMLLLHTAP